MQEKWHNINNKFILALKGKRDNVHIVKFIKANYKSIYKENTKIYYRCKQIKLFKYNNRRLVLYKAMLINPIVKDYNSHLNGIKDKIK